MKVDYSKSRYAEDPSAANEFNAAELRRLRYMLRRLCYLEAQINRNGGFSDGSGNGGAAFAEWEVEALEWLLKEVGFLPEQNREVSENTTQKENTR